MYSTGRVLGSGATGATVATVLPNTGAADLYISIAAGVVVFLVVWALSLRVVKK